MGNTEPVGPALEYPFACRLDQREAAAKRGRQRAAGPGLLRLVRRRAGRRREGTRRTARTGVTARAGVQLERPVYPDAWLTVSRVSHAVGREDTIARRFGNERGVGIPGSAQGLSESGGSLRLQIREPLWKLTLRACASCWLVCRR